MFKDLVMCITIILIIIVGDVLIKNYTTKKMDDMIYTLEKLKKEIGIMEQDIEEIKISGEKEKKVRNILDEANDKWDKMIKTMSFYIEHNELEKTETEMVELNANMDAQIFEEVIVNIEKTKYILEHIREKGTLKIKNIF